MTVVRRIRTRAVTQAVANPTVAERRARAKATKEDRQSAPKELDRPVVALGSQDGDPFVGAVQRASYKIQDTREGDYLHVSDLLSKCIRKRCLNKTLGIKAPSKRLSLSDMLTFAQGDAIHDVLKDVARRGDPGQVWGKWSCNCESLMHTEPCCFDEIDQDEECPHCHTTVTKYHEVSMFNEEHWIVGNPDMLQFLRVLQAYHITELKSISPDQYKELVRPKPEHVLQVVFYWWLMRALGYRLTNKCTIFYATKGWVFGGTAPYKSFLVDVQSELHRLDDMLEDAKAHKRSIQSIIASTESKSKKLPITLPPRVHCATKATKDAKNCEVCDICFEM
jgi:hypothetical protein